MFNAEHRTIKLESEIKISEVENLNWDNCTIFVNGTAKDKDYVIRDNDSVIIRQYPANGGSGGHDVATVFGWILMPVTSAIASQFGYNDGAFNLIHDSIKSIFETPEAPVTQDVGQTEQIPTISGAKNRSGANMPIPILLGETMYTPILGCQPYTDINPSDGSDGENQTFHALYVLGYRDIDLKSVSLGIYQLSGDEHNGTSGSLDCTNYEKSTISEIINLRPNKSINSSGATSSSFDVNAELSGREIVSISNVDTSNVAVKSTKNLADCYSNIGTSQSIQNVSVNKNVINIGYTNTLGGYPFLTGTIPINTTTKTKRDTSHYPVEDVVVGGVVRRKGYHQQLELQQNLVNGHGSEVSLFPQKVVQENGGTELMHPEGADWLTVLPFSAKYPQKIQIEVQFQNLVHFDEQGNQGDEEVLIGCAYSKDGGNTFLPYTPFIQSSGNPAVTNEGTANFSDGSGSYRITKFKGHKNKAMRFIAEKTFSYSEVFDSVKNNIIEFRIFRVSVDQSVTDSKHQSKCFFSAIRTWCYDYEATQKYAEEHPNAKALQPQRPLKEKYRDMTARLGFSIRAGEEINGTINELNVVMCSRAPYLNVNNSWQTQSTNNPASLALMLLQHPSRADYAYDGTKIDFDSFAEFFEWCNQTDGGLLNSNGHKYTANGVVSKQFKTIDLVNQILACGHGRLVIKGNKYGVLWDRPLDTPVMVLNNQNVLDAKNTKTFADEIDGYMCKYIDCINDYQEDTQIFVPKDLQKDPSEYKLESLELPWITDCKRAYRQAMYQLACRKLRPETWEVKLGVDGAIADVGSLVAYQSDTLLVGIGDGAQITEVLTDSGYVTGIKVDYGFEVADISKTYGIRIQHADAINGVNVRTYQLSDFISTGTKDTLIFAEPIAIGSAIVPKENDIVAFGIHDKVTTDAIVTSRKENQDGTYTLILVPYQNNIYDAELGTIPDYITNVTSPKEAGMAISEEIPSPTYEDVANIAQAVIEEGTDTPPDAPTNLTAVAEEIGIQLKWTPVAENGISNTIKHYVIEKSTDGGETWTALGTTFNSDFMYVFNRTTDKYPEADFDHQSGRVAGEVYLCDYRFRIKAVNIYGYESTYLSSTIDVSNYGTWKIPPLSIIKEVVDRTVILTAVYTGTVPKVYGLNRLKVWIKRNGNTDAEGGQSFNQILHVTPDDTWYTPEFNESVMGSESVNTEKNYHKFDENGTALTDPYITNSYKISHTLPLMGQCPRLYNGTDYVGITGDAIVVPSITEVEEVPASPIENQIILYNGETDEDFTEGKWYIYQNSWTELSDGFFIKYNGIATEDYKNGSYYVLDSDWTELIKKNPTMVTTEYVYKMTMFNESCTLYPQNARGASDTYVQALCTNIADIVHSHEHYKNLYVEKLSAINANLGMISQGGMGSFEDMTNCWALSDLSAEDSGVNGGVMKGTFRVGDENEYFRVTPYIDPNDSTRRKYKIELKAGNIELTTDVNGDTAMDFQNGTYVYNNDRSARMKLSSQGITAQRKKYTEIEPTGNENPSFLNWYEKVNNVYVLSTDTTVDSQKTYYEMAWEDLSKVLADEKGNMIISNSDKTPDFGYQVTGDVYHFDNPQNPTDEEVGVGETASNPQDIAFSGELIANDGAVIESDNSKYVAVGDVTKDVSSFTGNIVFLTKAEAVRTSGKAIGLDGSVISVPEPLIGYNSAMKQTSSIDSTKTVGAYLGLNETQIQTGIFY